MAEPKLKVKVIPTKELPSIPSKRYFTIGEVGDLCALKPHVLRYWEQEFSQLTPAKRRGNRRYYQAKDIELIRHIRELLYEKGFTIVGAKAQLQGNVAAVPASTISAKDQQGELKSIIGELESILDILQHTSD